MKALSAVLFFLSIRSALAQTPDFSKVREMIDENVSKKNIPSISIAVTKRGKIIWEESFGYADRENKVQATIHTPYYLASVTKTMTSMALLKLAKEKKINLDSPVNKYLKGGKINSTKWDANKVTVKMVMSHTSGLTTFNFWCRTDSLSCAKMDDTIIGRYAVLVDEPGAHFDYSNLGYGVLDRVIRDVSGKSYAEYMKEEIFGPLGMKSAFIAGNPLPLVRAMRYSGADGKTLIEFPYSHHYSAGASMGYASVHDLALFAMKHLSDRSLRVMQDTIARNGQDYYGLGWWIDTDYYGYKELLAQGGTFFAQAWLQLIPSEDISISILSNVGYGGIWRPIIDETLSALLPKFKANKIAEQNAPKNNSSAQTSPAPAPPPSKWKGYVRTYKGDVPVVFQFAGSNTGSVDIGNKHTDLSNVEVEPNWYSFKVEGDLGIEEDMGKPPYNMSFYLHVDGEILYGSAQTSATAHPDTPGLSFWVELEKVN
ncbi:MAG TPA: serine hydrolase domain-containing protein [Cyclobacteriaceae bacterium]|nr:serine hydrolase domain-containing protein [Cyclobacteriaceae bacterium]